MTEIQKPIVGFSCGDINGIGPEIIIKALADSRMLEFCTPVIFASNKTINFYRKAVGAKRRDVLSQFLMEAVILSLFGGVIGIVLGAVGIVVVARLVPDLAPTVTVDSVVLSTTFSIAVGLFFGIYPAFRASGLSPIEALRYE